MLFTGGEPQQIRRCSALADPWLGSRDGVYRRSCTANATRTCLLPHSLRTDAFVLLFRLLYSASAARSRQSLEERAGLILFRSSDGRLPLLVRHSALSRPPKRSSAVRANLTANCIRIDDHSLTNLVLSFFSSIRPGFNAPYFALRQPRPNFQMHLGNLTGPACPGTAPFQGELAPL